MSALDEQTIHDLLSNERRRRVLQLLDEHGELSVRELSELIAAAETGSAPPPRDARQSAYISLRQTHLDRLVDLDVVTLKDGGDVVRSGPEADAVRARMGPLRRFALSRAEYFALLAACGFLAVVASDVGAPVLGDVDDGLVAAVFLVLVVGSAAAQLVVTGERPSY